MTAGRTDVALNVLHRAIRNAHGLGDPNMAPDRYKNVTARIGNACGSRNCAQAASGAFIRLTMR